MYLMQLFCVSISASDGLHLLLSFCDMLIHTFRQHEACAQILQGVLDVQRQARQWQQASVAEQK